MFTLRSVKLPPVNTAFDPKGATWRGLHFGGVRLASTESKLRRNIGGGQVSGERLEKLFQQVLRDERFPTANEARVLPDRIRADRPEIRFAYMTWQPTPEGPIPVLVLPPGKSVLYHPVTVLHAAAEAVVTQGPTAREPFGELAEAFLKKYYRILAREAPAFSEDLRVMVKAEDLEPAVMQVEPLVTVWEQGLPKTASDVGIQPSL